jgi:flagellar hook-associated protein 2
MAITAAGLGSGLDIKSLVEQLVSAERQPVANRLALQEAKANAQLTALGRVKSALSGFRTAAEALSDIDDFQQRKTTVSNSRFLSATATSAAEPGGYAVAIQSWASAHRLVSGPFASAGSVVGEGQLVIGSGADSVQIEITSANNTLAGIRDAINGASGNPGVRASIVTGADGAHLILTATETGVANALTLDAVAVGSPLEALEFGTGTTNSLTESAAAADAEVTIDGLSVTSATNRIEGAIDGVTLELLQPDLSDVDLDNLTFPIPVQVDVDYDLDASRQSVSQFVTAYNSVITTINEVTAYNSEAKTGGALLGDAATRAIKESLRQILGSTVGGASDPFVTLAEIGISTETNGKLKFDTTRFNAAVEQDFDGVGRIFADESLGIAPRVEALLAQILGDDGRLDVRESTLKTRLEDIGDRRESLELRMEQVRKRYTAQFNSLDQLVNRLNQTSSFLTNQLGRL